MGANHHRYTEAFRVDALLRLAANGGNVNATAHELGVPEPTLRFWSRTLGRQVYAADYESKKQDLAQTFLDGALMALGVLPGKLEDASASQLATVAGICVDKSLILKGQANSIVGHVGKGAQGALKDIEALIGKPNGPEEADPVREPAPSTDNA